MASFETLQGLTASLADRGSKCAVVEMREKSGVREITFQELGERAEAFANGLADAGIGKGDHVAMMAENRPEWVVAALGVLRAGAVVVPMDVQMGGKGVRHVLENSGARTVVTTKRQVERLEDLELGDSLRFILLDADSDEDRSWEKLLKSERDAEFPEAGRDDVAVLFYTSGTTGPPKGVPLTHWNIVSQLDAVIEAELIKEGDRILLPLPFHHVYPFVVGTLGPLALGLPLVLPAALSGKQLIRALREGEVTAIIGVPRLYHALYGGITARVESSGTMARMMFRLMMAFSLFARRRLGWRVGHRLFKSLHSRMGGRLRLLATGGAPIDPGLAWKLEALGWRIAMGYGLTETSPLLTLNAPPHLKIGTVGKPIAQVEVRIDPEAIREGEVRGGDGDAGEILVRGPNVFGGYKDLPEETEEVLTEDKWFRTGDLGSLDGDGYLKVLGRLSTLIVTESGKNIQPDEVEEAYEKADAIKEMGVLMKDGQLVGLAVPEAGEIEDVDEVHDAIDRVSKKLPSYQRLSRCEVTRDALPRTRLGKIRRHQLEDRYEQAKEGKEKAPEPGPMPLEEMSGEDRALLEHAAAQEVWDLLARRFPDERLTPDTAPQLDLGIDSMGWLDLSLEISERTGVELSEDSIREIDTVRDLLEAVASEEEGGSVDPLENPEEALSEKERRWLAPPGPVTRAAARAVFALNGWVARGLFRLEVKGMENLPEEGPYLMTPNHTSYLDGPMLAAALGYGRLEDTHWAGARNIMLANPLLRLAAKLGKVLPLDTSGRSPTSIALGAMALKSGKNLIWFPEGWVSRDGELQDLKVGTGLLLEHYPVDVVPVRIEGAFQALPIQRKFPRFKPITVVIGEPVNAKKLENEGEGEKSRERILNALYARMASMKSSA